MVRAGRAPLLVLLAAALALPAAASAASAPFHPVLSLQSGHYTVEATGEGESVGLVVSPYAKASAGGPYSSSTYIARGTVSSHRLQASFGSLGSISMRFQPSPNRTWVKPGRQCHGAGRFLRIKGTWRGRLRFRGENDYLKVDVKQAKGVVSRVAPKCEAEQAGGKRDATSLTDPVLQPPVALRHGIEPSQESFFGEEVPYLDAGWRHAVRGAEFFAGADSEQSHFFFSAEESKGGLAIFRYAQVDSSPHRFRVDRALTRAHVSPPKPFRGSADFRAAADGSTTWSGALTVNVPGQPRRPLTGEPFEPKLALAPELAFAFLRSPAAAGAPRWP